MASSQAMWWSCLKTCTAIPLFSSNRFTACYSAYLKSPNENKKTLKNVEDQETEAKEEERGQQGTDYVPAICERCIGEYRENLQSHECYHQSKAVFKPYKMMRQILTKVKNPVPAEELFMKFRVRTAPRFM